MLAFKKLLGASVLAAAHTNTMTFVLTAASVAEYASKPFVRAALKNPSKPGSVLSFFLVCSVYHHIIVGCFHVSSHTLCYQGIDYDNPGNALREGRYILDMQQFWFAGGPEYDELCKPFSSVIRNAGSKTLPDDFWNTSVDGQVSQLILCDQLSRNCFRGTDEAYAHDDCSLDIARNLADTCIVRGEEKTLDGEFYPPYACFVATALMHSESLEDHELCLHVLDWASENAPQLREWWNGQREYELQHKRVIDEFGRYPYRNKKKGRKSTEKELEWLANEDDLPSWAKSQL